jgi:hypothetical protein
LVPQICDGVSHPLPSPSRKRLLPPPAPRRTRRRRKRRKKRKGPCLQQLPEPRQRKRTS